MYKFTLILALYSVCACMHILYRPLIVYVYFAIGHQKTTYVHEQAKVTLDGVFKQRDEDQCLLTCLLMQAHTLFEQ